MKESGGSRERPSFPNSCLGTLVAETPVSGRRETGVSRTDVPKQEFGNEKATRFISSECSLQVVSRASVAYNWLARRAERPTESRPTFSAFRREAFYRCASARRLSTTPSSSHHLPRRRPDRLVPTMGGPAMTPYHAHNPSHSDGVSWRQSWLDAYPCDMPSVVPYPRAPLSALLDPSPVRF